MGRLLLKEVPFPKHRYTITYKKICFYKNSLAIAAYVVSKAHSWFFIQFFPLPGDLAFWNILLLHRIPPAQHPVQAYQDLPQAY